MRTPSNLYRRMEKAFAIWQAAGDFLRLEPVRIQFRKDQSRREIRENNARVERDAAEALELAKDPFRLHAQAKDGLVMADGFLRAMLPDDIEASPSPDFAGAEIEPEQQEPDTKEKASSVWTDTLRLAVLKRFIKGKRAAYPLAKDRDLSAWAKLDPDNPSEEDLRALGLLDDPEWQPRFKDGGKMLDRFIEKGLPVEQVIAFASEFQGFANVDRLCIKKDQAVMAGRKSAEARKLAKEGKGICPKCGHQLKGGKCDCAWE